MKSIKIKLFLLATLLLIFNGCSKEKDDHGPQPAFDITQHFIAGTLTPKNGSEYTSVFFIRFLENDKAEMISSSANNLEGSYVFNEDELIFKVEGGNARTARFTLKDGVVTSAYYQALTTEYTATGTLFPLSADNALTGKVFKGEEFKMGGTSNQPGLVYRFNGDKNTFGSGLEFGSIDDTENAYTLIGGIGFTYTNKGHTELGYLSGNTLTVFKVNGLYYYGNYVQQ